MSNADLEHNFEVEQDILNLTPSSYHSQLRDHVKDVEPELWTWFAENQDRNKPDANVEDAVTNLLKACYRLDGEVFDELNSAAKTTAKKLGLSSEVTLYQEMESAFRNASVTKIGDGLHIVFSGDLLELLSLGEQQAILAHELAHSVLWQLDDGEFLTLDHAIHRMASEHGASDALVETARRLRLQTEVWADSVALAVTKDRSELISALVKISSGLRNVDPETYLAQAKQILEADPLASRAWSHPELHIRVACLSVADFNDADSLLATLIDGPDDLERLDLLAQKRVQQLTKDVLLCASKLFGDAAGIKSYLKTYEIARKEQRSVSAQTLADGCLAEAEPSIRYYCASLLVDVAFADETGIADSGSLDSLRDVSIEAKRLGLAGEFDRIIAQTSKRTIGEVRKLRTTRQQVSE